MVIVEAALLWVRSIMMAVSAIIVGLLSIMSGSGAGCEVMHRIKAPVVAGMLSATILTLGVLPIKFLIWKGRLLVGNVRK